MYRTSGERVFSRAQGHPLLRPNLLYHSGPKGSGLSLLDQSGYGRNASLVNGTAWTITKNGKRHQLQFDGTDDYVDLSATALLPATGDWTITCWVELFSLAATGTIFAQYLANVNNGRFLLRYDSTVPALHMFLGSAAVLGNQVVGTFVPTVRTSYHVAGRRIGNTFSFFINGQLNDTVTEGSTRSLLQTGNLLGITTNTATGYKDAPLVGPFNGTIDDFRIYNGGLSDALITLLAEE